MNSRNPKQIQYLTVCIPKERVKWFIAAILNNRKILILKPRKEGHASVQQGVRFSAINYCTGTKQENTRKSILSVNTSMDGEDFVYIFLETTYCGILAEDGATAHCFGKW